MLHWNILHNIYIQQTDYYIEWEYLKIEKCKFCTDEIDYIENFVWSCGKINLIWKKVEI